MGRPPLTEEQVRARVDAYCDRYGVAPGPQGLPPFPTGRRESAQHRDWQAVYRALQRLDALDVKTSSWIATCPQVRALGGALFCDRRYGKVFVYHNGAQSYYASRGFRGVLRV